MADTDSLIEEHRQEIERRRRERNRLFVEVRDELQSTASLQGSGGGTPSPGAAPSGASPSPEDDGPVDGGVLGTLSDVGTQLVGGVYDGLDSMLTLPFELAGSDTKVDLFHNVDPSKTMAGGFARGIGQFAIGMVPGLSVIRTLNYATKGLKAVKAIKAATASTPVINKLGNLTGAAAVADFVAFEGNQGRLTDMLSDMSEEHPSLEPLVMEFLQTDDDDSKIMGRLKNTVEGLILGGVADLSIAGLVGVARNVKLLDKLKRNNLEVGVEEGLSREMVSSVDELLRVSDDLADVKSIRELVDSGRLTQADIDAAEFAREPGESTLDAAKRRASGQPDADPSPATRAVVATKTGFRHTDDAEIHREFDPEFLKDNPLYAEWVSDWYILRDLMEENGFDVVEYSIPKAKLKGMSEFEIRRARKMLSELEDAWLPLSEGMTPRQFLGDAFGGLNAVMKEGKVDTGLDFLPKKLTADEIAKNKAAKRKILREKLGIHIVDDAAPTPRAKPTTPLTQSETSVLARLKESNPEAYARAVEGMEQVRQLEGELEDQLVKSKENFTNLRTSHRSALAEDDLWKDAEARAGSVLDPAQVDLIEKHKAIPMIDRRDALKASGEIENIDRVLQNRRDKRFASPSSAEVLNPKTWAKRIRKDYSRVTDSSGLADAFVKMDVRQAAKLLDDGNYILEVDIPVKGEKFEDFWRRTRFFQSLREATKGGEESLRTGGRRAGKVQTNVETERLAQQLVDNVAKDPNARQLIDEVDGASEQSLSDFLEFMMGRVDLDRAPQIVVGAKTMLFEMRVAYLQRANTINAGLGDDLALAEFHQLRDLIASIEDAYSGNVSSVARTLQASGITPGGNANNDWWRAMNEHIASSNINDTKQIARLVSAAGDAKSIGKMARAHRNKRHISRVISELFTNSILSGGITFGVNAISGAAMTLYKPTEALAGSILRLNLKQARVELAVFRGAVETFRGMVRMSARVAHLPVTLKPAVGTDVAKNVWQSVKTSGGVVDERTAFDEARHAITAKNFKLQDGTWAGWVVNAFGNLARLPGRVMVATDELIKGMNYNMRLSRNGYEAAIEAGVDDVDTYVRQYMSDAANWDNISGRTESAIAKVRHEEALEYARRATFQQDLGDGFSKTLQGITNKYPAARLVMPFVRTPSNILKFVGRRTPIINGFSKEVQADLAAGGIRAQLVRDRMNVSTAIWATAMITVSQGLVTGSGPQDRNERQAWYDAGWQPYSIWMGTDENGKNKWFSYRRGDPFGMFLGIAADLNEVFITHEKDEQTIMEVTTHATYALAANLKSRSYFTGITQLLDTIDSPENKMGHYLEGMASNVIPNFFSQLRRFGPDRDEYMRETNGLMDTLLNRIPGGSSTQLMPRRNIYGEKQKYPIGVSASTVNPFFSVKNGISPEILKKLQRGELNINSVNDEQKVAFTAVQVGFNYGMDNFDMLDGVELTPEQRDKFIVLTGENLKRSLGNLVTNPGWRLLSDPVPGDEDKSGKHRAFRRVFNIHKARARERLILEDKALFNSIVTEKLRVRALKQNRPDAVLGRSQVDNGSNAASLRRYDF